MAQAEPSTITLQLDGKTVEVKTPSPLNAQINDVLNDPKEFQSFASDPAAFTKRFGLSIDPDISNRLKESIGTAKSLDDLRSGRGTPIAATVWAIAVAAYSLSSTKIAVAFLEK
jgi:hypothetical protein